MNADQMLEYLKNVTIEYVPKLIGAILIWIIGVWLIKIISYALSNMLDKRKIDPTLKPFIKGLLNSLLKVLLVITILSTLGVEMTSFVAIIGAAGLAIGLALSGTLQNFAGSVVILIFKPYKVGDYIESQGNSGTVSEIQIFNTILKTPDNKTIFMPNGAMANSSLTNYSAEAKRRVDWTFGIGYGDDADKARAVITRLCAEDSRILNDPSVFIALSALGDSSVNFVVRAWVNTSDYWNVFFDLNEKVYKTFEKEGLNIPFPQMDLHLHNQE